MRKILIVDDHHLNRAVLKKILNEEYEILEAKDGEVALSVLEANRGSVSAVLLDLLMPVLDGYGVLEKMRADSVLADIPVVVTTGTTDEGAEARALALGANDFVAKPYNPKVIRRRLRNAIELHEAATIISASRIDALTGLYSRTAFLEQAEGLIRQKPVGYYAMSCLDIDNFKVVNDQYGDAKGDELLKFIAETFRTSFEPGGGICTRIMADHFAVLYPKDRFGAARTAQIRAKAAAFDGSILPVTFSVGRYVITDLSLPVSAMYDRAAMAKASVKRTWDGEKVAEYDESMRQRILREQEIINEMKPALAGGQFEVWLQPQYNHSSGAIIGAEALVRWRHPKRGLVSPCEFIPVFESNGFIYELDRFVWETSCSLLRRWLDEGRDALPISVNVSRVDLLREGFFETITGLLTRYSLPISYLRLEVTESAFSDPTGRIIGVVERLVNFGFTVEIDDFGSGYSSLNTLKDVPANILKLDMRFLKGNKNTRRGGNIVESVIRMARWLGMPVIAEGVETKGQADYLSSVGCFYVQGYLYAKPMTVPEYERLSADSGKERAMIALETVETLDNDAFWDPKSMETLIFNSYVGGACVFEYSDGRTELLRVNAKYAQELGGASMTMEDALAFRLEDHLDEENREWLFSNIRLAIETDSETTCEVRVTGLSGGREDIYLRTAIRMIARAGSRVLFYCSIINRTAQRMAELQLLSSAEQLTFLNETAHCLLSEANPDSGIHEVLTRILGYFGGNRAYIMETDEEKEIVRNTYEVCAPGVVGEKENLQSIPFRVMSFWFDAFRDNGFISISDTDAIEGERSEERQMLLEQNIRSLVAVPLRRDGRQIGFIGVDDPAKHQFHVGQLQAIGDYIAFMLVRRDLTEKIERDNRAFISLMNDTPGGFVRMRVHSDGRIIPVYVNEGFCRMVGMKADEVLAFYRESAMKGVHPDDLEIVGNAVNEMLVNGETRSSRYRLRNGSGGYVWVRFFGRSTVGDNGKTYLNVYYTKSGEPGAKDESNRENELVMAMVAAHSNRTVYRYDPATKTAYADISGATRTGAKVIERNVPESVISRGAILPESVEDYRRAFRGIHDGNRDGNVKLHVRRQDGSVCWMDMKYSVIFSEDHMPKSAVLSFLDITAEHERELAYDRYQQTINRNENESGTLTFFEADLTSNQTEKFGGIPLSPEIKGEGQNRADVIGILTWQYVNVDERDRCREFFSREHLITLFSDGVRSVSEEWSVVLREGQLGYIRAELQMVEDPYSGHIKAYTILRDITVEKQAELEVRRQAEIDGMTGLYNKTTTEKLIRHRLGRADGALCALLIADLDNLKEINDNFGHDRGDEAIRLIAGALKTQFLAQGGIAGRIGGDEFAVFLDNGGNEAALRATVTAFMHKLSAIRVGDDGSLLLHGSVGLSIGTAGIDSYEDLFKKADKALYHVKRNGKNDYSLYDEEMEDAACRRRGHTGQFLWAVGGFDSEETANLACALSVLYPQALSVNLTQDSYSTLQYKGSNGAACIDTGKFERLTVTEADRFHPDDREEFLRTFSRENLLAATVAGEKTVRHEGRRRTDGGEYRLVRTDAVCLGISRDGDTRMIIFSREL